MASCASCGESGHVRRLRFFQAWLGALQEACTPRWGDDRER